MREVNPDLARAVHPVSFGPEQMSVLRATLGGRAWRILDNDIDEAEASPRATTVVLVHVDDDAGLSQVARHAQRFRTVAIVAEDSVAAARQAFRAGATDCLADRDLRGMLPGLLDAIVPPASKAPSGPSAGADAAFEGLISTAPAIQAALNSARKAAQSRISVLLTGPSGSGKERFASAIHEASPRRSDAFIAVNCGALPEQLVESTLFGHEKGAFTGADRASLGRFRAADGGTLFLDEVGELPSPAQVKLLRVLQEGVVDPVGGRAPVPVNVRVLAATNRDLRAEIAAGRFREDLFFRLAGIEIALPPLRDRRDDIVPLALQHARSVAAMEGRAFAGFAPGVEDWLTGQNWDGNVRELHNAVHRALVMSDTPLIEQSAFEVQQITAPAATASDPGERRERRQPPEIRRLEEIEAEMIADALLLCRGNVSVAARKLGIGRSTLYRKMAAFGIAQPAGCDPTVDLTGPSA